MSHWLRRRNLNQIASTKTGAIHRLIDPRADNEDREEGPEASQLAEELGPDMVFKPIGPSESDRWLSFLILNQWVFTLGDVDCYPSVPHGHLHKKTNSWPKLNPYVGRVFSGMHQELVRSRLKRHEMALLWNDQDFVRHCRDQVLWYSGFAPSYTFPNARRGKLRFPRWRR